MYLFKSTKSFNDVKTSLNNLCKHIENLVPIISKDILNNIIILSKKKINKQLCYDSVINNDYLLAYSIITVGSYLNGRKLLKGIDWEKTITYIKNNLSNFHKIENIDSKINYLNQFENNRMEQAARLIKVFIDSNSIFEQLTIEEQGAIFSYIVPLIEYMGGYIIIYIDLIIDKKHIPKQRKILLEIEKMIDLTYNVEIDLYHELLRHT